MRRVGLIVFMLCAMAFMVLAVLTPLRKQLAPPPPTFPVFPTMPEVVPGGVGDNTPDGVWILNRATGEWRTANIADVKKGDVFDREICRGHRQRCYAMRDIEVWPHTDGRSWSMEAITIGETYTDFDGGIRYIGEDWAKFIDRMSKMYPGILPERKQP